MLFGLVEESTMKGFIDVFKPCLPRLDDLELIIGAISWVPPRIFSDVAPLQGIRLKKATLSSNIFSTFFKVRILNFTTSLALNGIYKTGHFHSDDTLKKALEDLACMLSRDSFLYELSLWKIDYSRDDFVGVPGVGSTSLHSLEARGDHDAVIAFVNLSAERYID